MINYHELNTFMRTASAARYPIEGYGDLPLIFRSNSGDTPMLLRNAAHVPSLKHHLLSLGAGADKFHTCTGNHDGATVLHCTVDTLFFPSIGRIIFLYAYRLGMHVDETANSNIAPVPPPSNRDTPVDINNFHVAHAHTMLTKIKRLLAFSSVRHVGFLCIGLASGSIEGVQGVLFTLVMYMLTDAF